MITMIERLIAAGHAYEADGHVCSTCRRARTTASCPAAIAAK
jgi:cysteinyl-tRNA synthetase